MRASPRPPELVLNGYPLLLRQMGTGVYTARLIHGLLRRAPERALRVVVPAELRAQVCSEFPEEIFDFLPGRPPINRSIARDIYWNMAVARHVGRRHPAAIFHAPADMWAPVRPRRLMVTHYDCVYRHFPRMQGGLVRRWWWFATERYARRADRALTLSQHSRADLIRLARVPEERVRVIYPWVDTFASEVERGQPSASHAGMPEEYLLYVGGYTCNKNVERLIAGYARARRVRSLPPLVLVGAIPPRHPALAVCDVQGAIEEAGLSPEHLRLVGPVRGAALPEVYRKAKLFISPSLHEGFGYPPAEAMAMGTPLIVADRTSLVEVVRDPRCRFDPTSIDAIAGKILEAEADPHRFSCSLPGEFTEAAGIRAYLELIDELRGERR